MKINKDFEELFELLNKNNVAYIIVGGYAFAIHVEPRFTKDLGVFIKRDVGKKSDLEDLDRFE